MSDLEHEMNDLNHDGSNRGESKRELKSLALLFLKLGATAFGGPAAHIALMEREVVAQRGWLSRQEFLDLVSATNLIPGPNSTEMAMHIGQKRAGSTGLLVAGAAFIAPAFFMVLALAWLYQQYGALPQARWMLNGMQPVIVAVIIHALANLAQTAIKNIWMLLLAALVATLAFTGVSEIALIFLAAMCGLVRAQRLKVQNASTRVPSSTEASQTATEEPEQQTNDSRIPALLWLGATPMVSPTLSAIFWTFLKIGSVVYGSGYVLLAFLRDDLVERLHWISDKQLLDAISMGQITPGPVFTTATFIGYLLGGAPGAMAATIGIFLPAFVFVVLLAKVMEQLRNSPPARAFLDVVNAASLALMAVVTWQLFVASMHSVGTVFTFCAAILALVLLFATRLNPLWLMLLGALAGWLLPFAPPSR